MMAARPLARIQWAPHQAVVRQRVLFLADHLGCRDGGVHGVTTYLLDILPNLKKAGTEVAACFLREEHPAAAALREQGIETIFLETRRYNFLAVRFVDEIVRRGSYNILHCTQLRASVLGRAVANLRRDRQVILHMHDLAMPPVPVRLINKILAHPSDSGLCVSHACLDVAVHGYYVPSERVHVVYTGIDANRFRPLPASERARVRRNLGFWPGTPVMCLVGRFHPIKGQRTMLRMLKHILLRRPDCMLLFIGSGDDRAACEELTRQMNLARHVRFLGHRDDIEKLLPAADVAVVPSSTEGLSRCAVEANLCGVPVVGYACGGISDALVNSSCGELVAPGDEQGFTKAVIRALDAPDKRATAIARVAAARERFGLPGHVRTLQAWYESLLPETR